MGNGMNKVLPGLYVGNYRDSKDAVQLDRFNITHIVAIHDSARKIHPDKHYLCVLASDTVEQNLAQFFPLCNDFIHAARLRGGCVLIHCLAGMSRSVTVTIAYIMSVTSLNWKEALKVVRVGRAIANPNNGFQKQLQDFECFRLADERRRLRERFPSRALASMDEEQCQLLLIAYQGLLSGKHICEGNCAMGEICPTGMCRASRSRTNRRKTSSTSLQNFACASSSSSSSHLTRSNSTLSPKRRPSSSPSKLSGSAPASPKSSVLDLSIYPETPEDSHSLLATLSLPGCSSAPPSPHPRTSSSQKLLRKISLHRTS
ncbi:hypothetical protein M8J76_006413 [Diaphorina citri]|nr:hypothetical protein M8J75_000067 [Diaphorina citri]KAI5719183.1 hypothetical protein M8J76_006413 [Diaphorina citri]KAI5721843.1 hypothetical protein M8J77_026396 [Diaphorina citri]